MFQLGEHVIPPAGGLQITDRITMDAREYYVLSPLSDHKLKLYIPISVLEKDRRAGFGQRGRTAQPVPGGRAGGHPLDCRPERQVPPIRRIRTERGPAGNPEAFKMLHARRKEKLLTGRDKSFLDCVSRCTLSEFNFVCSGIS